MTNKFGGPPPLIHRVSTVDGTIHLNRGLRDAHDATARAERARKQAEMSRKQMEMSREASRRAMEAMRKRTKP